MFGSTVVAMRSISKVRIRVTNCWTIRYNTLNQWVDWFYRGRKDEKLELVNFTRTSTADAVAICPKYRVNTPLSSLLVLGKGNNGCQRSNSSFEA